MSADNAIFVVKTGTPKAPIFGVFHTSASWFQELWLDVESVREPELRWTKKPNADRLAELFAEGEQFTNEADALACAARLADEISYAEYGVQFVNVTGKHEAWDKGIAWEVLKAAHIQELAEAVEKAVEAMEPGETIMFPNTEYGENALLICFPLLKSELYYSASCEWVPGEGDKPESYKLTRRNPAEEDES